LPGLRVYGRAVHGVAAWGIAAVGPVKDAMLEIELEIESAREGRRRTLRCRCG
jgi:hypothetical protein